MQLASPISLVKALLVPVSAAFCTPAFAQQGETIPKLPIGMNIPGLTYWSECVIFNDVMTTSSPWITFNAEGQSPWDTKLNDQIKWRDDGYPTELPAIVDGKPAQAVRTLVNNYYRGWYLFLYDGEGKITFNVKSDVKDGVTRIYLDGTGGHKWFNILQSSRGNPIRNIRILPEQYAGKEPPLFHADFIEGLRPFHALRFMDWMRTNNSSETLWAERVRVSDRTQAERGIAIEHAVELCNQLKADAWFCVPHQADDDYIRQFARLVKQSLNPQLKVYIEYSNELWNWQFGQAHYVLKNAPGARDAYVSADLAKITPQPADHPEKDAYMMARAFRIWREEFKSAPNRLICVAGVQHAWTDNTRRILKYLFSEGRGGCDVVSPAAYFGFEKEDHEKWLAMDPKSVTPEMIIEAVHRRFQRPLANGQRRPQGSRGSSRSATSVTRAVSTCNRFNKRIGHTIRLSGTLKSIPACTTST